MKTDKSIIQYIESVEQAERHLERIQQFGVPIVAFDLCLDLDPRSVPFRLLFCPSCPVVYYLSLDEECPTHCELVPIEMVHVRLIIQGDTVVYRRPS